MSAAVVGDGGAMLDNPGLVQQNHYQRVERAIFAHIYQEGMR
jgi:hypothetical protein